MSSHQKVDRKQIWIVFVALFVLTVLEVGVAYVETSRLLVGAALVFLALAKAALVMLFYMHLIHETNSLKKTVILPFLFPFLFAFVLIAESAWRGTWVN